MPIMTAVLYMQVPHLVMITDDFFFSGFYNIFWPMRRKLPPEL